jgi:hypothetical protein
VAADNSGALSSWASTNTARIANSGVPATIGGVGAASRRVVKSKIIDQRSRLASSIMRSAVWITLELAS